MDEGLLFKDEARNQSGPTTTKSSLGGKHPVTQLLSRTSISSKTSEWRTRSSRVITDQCHFHHSFAATSMLVFATWSRSSKLWTIHAFQGAQTMSSWNEGTKELQHDQFCQHEQHTPTSHNCITRSFESSNSKFQVVNQYGPRWHDLSARRNISYCDAVCGVLTLDINLIAFEVPVDLYAHSQWEVTSKV